MMQSKTRTGHPTSKLWRALLPIGLIVLLTVLAACGPSAPVSEDTDSAENNAEVVDSTASITDSDNVSAAEPTTPDPESDSESGYPPPATMPEMTEAESADGPYPPPERPTVTPAAYPGEQEVFLEPRFSFDTPLRVGDRVVSGQAPADMQLAVISVTFNGQLLGTGASSEDNTFSINVAELQEGHLIGITFAELEPGLDYVGMTEKYFPYRGDGFINLPNVGVILDSAQVEP